MHRQTRATRDKLLRSHGMNTVAHVTYVCYTTRADRAQSIANELIPIDTFTFLFQYHPVRMCARVLEAPLYTRTS